MEIKAEKISERLLEYGVSVIQISMRLEKTTSTKTIASQLLRAATSAGANYEEARGAESRADFVHKLQIVLKEIRESIFWLKLIEKSQLLKGKDIKSLLEEANQLSKIIARSVITTRKQKN